VTDPSEQSTEVSEQIATLKQELWVARDAAIGATAELGSARARVRELEVRNQQLEVEVARCHADMNSRAVKLVLAAVRPLRKARGLPT
jgi:hypothetical protein